MMQHPKEQFEENLLLEIEREMSDEQRSESWRGADAPFRSELNYQTLFDSIDVGLCVIEVIFDADEKAVDYLFLEANAAFEKQSGIISVVGKKMLEIAPAHDKFWFQTYGQVAQTGESVRFEHRADALGRWFDVYAFRAGKPESRQVAVLFTDISRRKQSEENLVLLAEINQDLARLTNFKEIMHTVGAKIGEHLRLAICNFIEINDASDRAMINYSWHSADAPGSADAINLREFLSEEFRRAGSAGELMIVSDTQTDARVRAENYAERRIGSFLGVPFVRHGRWRFLLVVYHSAPHDWQPLEIQLVSELTTRVWTRLERVRADDLIRESHEKLQTALEAGKMGSWQLDLKDDALTASDTCKKNYGRQIDEAFSYQDLAAAVHPNDFKRWRETVDAAIEHCKDFEIEYRVRWRDDSLHWLLARGNCFADETGKTSMLAGVSIDITERKTTEQMLLERARLDNLYGGIGNALVQTDDLNNLLKRCVEALIEHLDVALARIWTLDAAGKTLELIASAGLYTHLDGAHSRVPVGKYKIGLIAAERTPHLTNEVFSDPRVSDQEWARRENLTAFAGYPLIVENRLVGVIGVFSKNQLTALTLEAMESISKGIANAIERKRIEEDRRILLASEREARLAAENANRLKDEFLATLSHELRTPLNAILGWSQILQKKQLNETEAKKALSTIERNARSQNQLIDDLLDVSRIITGKLRLDVRSVDLSNIITAAIEAARPAAEAKNIRLQTLLDSQAGPISGDPDRLQQIVWNLLSNAVKFTPKGGRVQIRLERVNSHVEIVISDTGKGIEPEFMPHVFDRFRQSDGSMTRRHGGLGLGLAIVRQLVELHGGTVAATSAGDAEGAVFTVCLPLLPVRREPESDVPRVHPAARKDLPLSDSLPELNNLRVLLVDDEADSRELLSLVLGTRGALITSAGSAAAALEQLNAGEFDVIVSDIGMPEEDGFSLIGRVRRLSDAKGGGTPAIALTAYARAEDRVQALRAGFQMHIAKPVEPDELVVAVANLAGRMRNPKIVTDAQN